MDAAYVPALDDKYVLNTLQRLVYPDLTDELGKIITSAEFYAKNSTQCHPSVQESARYALSGMKNIASFYNKASRKKILDEDDPNQDTIYNFISVLPQVTRELIDQIKTASFGESLQVSFIFLDTLYTCFLAEFELRRALVQTNPDKKYRKPTLTVDNPEVNIETEISRVYSKPKLVGDN